MSQEIQNKKNENLDYDKVTDNKTVNNSDKVNDEI